MSLIGSKEGIAHFPLAFVNPGDLVLIATPNYPVYGVTTEFVGGVPMYLPLTDESRHMISEAELALMKPDAVLINVSRGGIVDEVALAAALQRGHLFGAGLDVFEVEPPPPDHPLLAFDNLIATPHAAGGTHDTPRRSATQVAQQVLDVLNGGPVAHRVV